MAKTSKTSDPLLDAGLARLKKSAEDAKVSETLVTNFMSEPEVCLLDGTKIYAAIQTLASHGLTGVPVVDRRGKLMGMVSEYDLLMQAATRDVVEPITYTRDVLTLGPEATLRDCIVALYKKKVRRIPVVDMNYRVVGIVSRMDVLKRLISPKKS